MGPVGKWVEYPDYKDIERYQAVRKLGEYPDIYHRAGALPPHSLAVKA